MKKSTKVAAISSLAVSITLVLLMTIHVIITYHKTGEVNVDEVEKAVETAIDGIEKYNMTNEQIEELPTTTIDEKTEEEEQEAGEEQATIETEGFEEQGEIAYNGTSEYPSITLGSYQGLTYYSQIDGRWSSHPYTSTGNNSQTIGSSGCGPSSAAMVVTATKGTITPPEMGDLFVKYGYRSANNGTYDSAFRWVADTFDIDYNETYNTDNAINLLRNNNYVVVACGNGLFTTGGHFIVLTGIDGDTISVYDPYLYSGKFETSTRRGKVSVSGNTTYVSVSNFKNYANPKKFFAYQHSGNVPTNNTKPVVTNSYTRYVKVSSSLRVRNAPNGSIVGSLKNGTAVTVYETSGNWSRIGTNRWVSSLYLSTGTTSSTSNAVVSSTGKTYRLKSKSYIYTNSNLTGKAYSYLAQTQIKVLSNVSSTIDYVQVVKTGRKGYIKRSSYTTTTTNTQNVSSSSVGQYKRLRIKTNLYSNSNLTGTKYPYLAQTQVQILKHISANVDYVKVVKTGRKAYINRNAYK